MIAQSLVDALNDQINFELYSAYTYMSMGSYFKGLNLNGFANWLDVQVKEELSHTNKIYGYIHERGGKVILDAIEQPQIEWESPLDAFEVGLEHEGIVTARINSLMDLALDEKDHATSSFLQWFINEQVEEEASFQDIVQQLKLIEGAPQGLFMIDREMVKRVYNQPV